MSERDPRIQQLLDDPDAYFAEARARVRIEVMAAIKREEALRRRQRKERRWRWLRFAVRAQRSVEQEAA